jgi:very-short-patch-repair endonuclease
MEAAPSHAPDPDREVDALGAATMAVWTRRAALERCTPAQVATFLRTGVWQSPWPGVLADAGFVLDPGQRAHAAVLASGGEGQPFPVPGHPRRARVHTVAIGRTAARCWQLPLIDDDDPATGACEHLLDDVCVPQHVRPVRHTDAEGRRHELRRHRATFGPGEVVQHPCGVFVSSPARTVLDCAVLLPLAAAVCVVDAALQRELVRADVLAAGLSTRRRHPHSRRLAEVLRLADGRAESPGETLTRLLLLPVLPGLEPQVRLRDRGRIVARFDLADPSLRLAVEHDGRRGHEGRAADDQRRDAVSSRLGWTTERVTWFDVRRRQAATVARVAGTADRIRRGAGR